MEGLSWGIERDVNIKKSDSIKSCLHNFWRKSSSK
uniref:Uncharacterized protein n=1 Tax=Rhizophora mucronata TaxID=61149 RepID=A0A2P2NDG9_RHIMU